MLPQCCPQVGQGLGMVPGLPRRPPEPVVRQPAESRRLRENPSQQRLRMIGTTGNQFDVGKRDHGALAHGGYLERAFELGAGAGKIFLVL